MVSSRARGFKPRPAVNAPCGSKSTKSTLCSLSLRAAPRLIVVVVLPTPPFCCAIAITVVCIVFLMPAHWVSGFLVSQYNIILGYQHTSKMSCRLSAYAKACKDGHRRNQLGLDSKDGNLLLNLTEALLVGEGNGAKVLGGFLDQLCVNPGGEKDMGLVVFPECVRPIVQLAIKRLLDKDLLENSLGEVRCGINEVLTE